MALFTFHIHNHIDIEKLFAKIDFIIKTVTTMSQITDEVKALINSALGKVDRIEADTTLLLKKISELPNSPELQEIKDLATVLDQRLHTIDEKVPEEITPPDETRGRTMKTGG